MQFYLHASPPPFLGRAIVISHVCLCIPLRSVHPTQQSFSHRLLHHQRIPCALPGPSSGDQPRPRPCSHRNTPRRCRQAPEQVTRCFALAPDYYCRNHDGWYRQGRGGRSGKHLADRSPFQHEDRRAESPPLQDDATPSKEGRQAYCREVAVRQGILTYQNFLLFTSPATAVEADHQSFYTNEFEG